MPTILRIGPYVFFFWVGENNEPVHVHVAIGNPAKTSTKFWLTSNGGCVLANNGSRFSNKELRNLSRTIAYNHAFICERWTEVFGKDSLRFYL